jgi:uncharacterized membrane protein YcjF (UPF0283 family)
MAVRRRRASWRRVLTASGVIIGASVGLAWLVKQGLQWLVP